MKSQPLRRLSFLRALQASRRSTRRRRRTFNRLYAPPTDEDQEAVGGSVPGVLLSSGSDCSKQPVVLGQCMLATFGRGVCFDAPPSSTRPQARPGGATTWLAPVALESALLF